MPDGLDWTTIRPTRRIRAVELTPENAQAVADQFGGEVRVVPGWAGVTITRLHLGLRDGPARGWITEDGRWLNENEWEADDAIR